MDTDKLIKYGAAVAFGAAISYLANLKGPREKPEEEEPSVKGKEAIMRTQSDNADKAEYFLEVVTSRFSCKKFNGKPVSNEVLSKLQEATTHAPTCFNTQPYVCKVVTSDEAKAKLKAALIGANAERLDKAAGALVWGADLKVEVAEGIRSYVDTFIGQCACPQAWAYKQTSMACATFCLAAQAELRLPMLYNGYQP